MIIQCLFETIDDSVLEEAGAIFNVLFLSTKFDVHITLENPVYITQNFITMILNLGKELHASGRQITVLNAPESMIRYIDRFQLGSIVRILNDGNTSST